MHSETYVMPPLPLVGGCSKCNKLVLQMAIRKTSPKHLNIQSESPVYKGFLYVWGNHGEKNKQQRKCSLVASKRSTLQQFTATVGIFKFILCLGSTFTRSVVTSTTWCCELEF